MITHPSLSLLQNGLLSDFSTPRVMGILNVTPDSFYSASRKESEEAIANRVEQIISEGGDFIDIGAYSSRPGAEDIPLKVEMERMRKALSVVRKVAPEAMLSIDTFRSEVAVMSVEEFGAGIINDISAGELDDRMFDTVARLGVAYIMMHMQGTPQTMHQQAKDVKEEEFIKEIFGYFAIRIQELHERGVKDIILDPGFGFGKTLEQNYLLIRWLKEFKIFELPILVGVSRKSMIYKTLECSPEEALNGTTSLHTHALMQGANILRVHDVKEAVECVKLYRKVMNQ
ncbi:MAG: dihydropteroate synthase [Bacteroidaceae bacterium]|nr:dihydropteroate synthase [Bacteroidaceae bacterium]